MTAQCHSCGRFCKPVSTKLRYEGGPIPTPFCETYLCADCCTPKHTPNPQCKSPDFCRREEICADFWQCSTYLRHTPNPDCWCEPTLKDGVWIHHTKAERH
jgi:hypothetical protein